MVRQQHHRAFRRLKTLITALYGLPPVVVGVFVYSLFSKSGALGSLDLLFTVEAMIFAQTCLILPLVWGGSWTAFEGVGKTSSDTLATLGINERQRLFLEIRLASNGVYHAVVIAFGRAIAEVGAVIMVGGNIAGKTRVMTTSIVLETSKGNMEQAGVLGLLLLALSLALVGLAAMVQTRRKRSTEPILGRRCLSQLRLKGRRRKPSRSRNLGGRCFTRWCFDSNPAPSPPWSVSQVQGKPRCCEPSRGWRVMM